MPSWVIGHIYVVDKFLHFMARFGYTLQKTRVRDKYEDTESIGTQAFKAQTFLREFYNRDRK